ncbi:regulatory protein TetR [Catenovulum agarivorans DS-2]|uniref:Regulatory protein TetR n=1 Tax=Catenovulum agarivorans DS-2 TaxID=1328313 RepID=W7Q828_9ALTE|nr:TetR/AcrR family transcriptional regulator [Catenovulum agarivorans]EWH08111.1 regulatory protein TetR [Catenovulum agarivorans DS-2]
MGRHKAFEPEVVKQQLLLAFWELGYEACTYAALEKRTGVTGKSLVNTFGDKNSLFELALKDYLALVDTVLAERFATANKHSIVQFFTDLANSKPTSPRNFGCFICNALFEAHAPQHIVEQAHSAFTDKLTNAFQRALAADDTANAPEVAKIFVSLFWGIMTEVRQAKSTQVVQTKLASIELLLQKL